MRPIISSTHELMIFYLNYRYDVVEPPAQVTELGLFYLEGLVLHSQLQPCLASTGPVGKVSVTKVSRAGGGTAVNHKNMPYVRLNILLRQRVAVVCIYHEQQNGMMGNTSVILMTCHGPWGCNIMKTARIFLLCRMAPCGNKQVELHPHSNTTPGYSRWLGSEG